MTAETTASVHRPLLFATAIATLIVLGLLSVIPLPRNVSIRNEPGTLTVSLVGETRPRAAVPSPIQPANEAVRLGDRPAEARQPTAADDSARISRDPVPPQAQAAGKRQEAASEPAGPGRQDAQPDWQATGEAVAREFRAPGAPDGEFSPLVRESRQQAAERFRPAPERAPRQAVAEVDPYGRTVLRSGNCYRILDDQTLTLRWMFEQFQQYVIYCGPNDDEPDPLPDLTRLARVAYSDLQEP